MPVDAADKRPADAARSRLTWRALCGIVSRGLAWAWVQVQGQVVMEWRSGLRVGRIVGVTLAYLVQHGEKQHLPGDPGLTQKGRQQATDTGRWLRGQGVRALYSSPLRRARQTAGCIASVTGLAVQLDDRLRERLNWDGSEPFEAFLAVWARTTRERGFVPPKGTHHRRQGHGCGHSWLTCPEPPGRSRRSPTAASPATCCATCSETMRCPGTCWMRASRRVPSLPSMT
jgi:Histidine phosphatase superfamily (branch 1)